MSITVRMLGWSAKGLRCPDYTISFKNENAKIYPVTLIQMPNGTGKTTTLNLLRATLSGQAEVDRWNSTKVNSFQKKKGPSSTGEFQVTLECNGQLVTLTLTFNFDEGTVKYNTTVGKGNQVGFKPPRECRDFLNKDFINFFVFDGELAKQLLNANYTNAERAIENLYKLKYLKSIENVVDGHWDDTVKAAKVTTGDRALIQRKNRVEILIARIDKLTKERDAIKASLKKIETDLKSLESKYQVKIHQHDHDGKEYDEKKEVYDLKAKEVEQLTQQILKQIRSPHFLSANFAIDVLTLKENLDSVKLPESAAKEFFQEFAEKEEYCICGRALEEEHRLYIREKAASYLGSEEMALLNAIKSDITGQIGSKPKEFSEKFNENLNLFRQAIDERGLAKTDLDAVESNITSANAELKEAKEKIDGLKERESAINDQLKKYQDKDDKQNDDDKTFGIEALKQRLAEAREKLAEITHTVEIKQKTDLLKIILAEALSIAKGQIATSLKDDANNRIANLLPNNDIRITKIDKAVYLDGQDSGSEGENLSVAYAFMATLFSNTERQLPFIVDSPAVSIDDHVRSKVAKLIPKLTDQFIAFTISSERGGFVLPLEKASQAEIQYVTLFRKGDHALEELAKNHQNVEYSTDSICVFEREFFFKFHKETEQEE